MELAIFIKELLFNHSSVVVPGLGTFHLVYQPSTVAADQHSILPPAKHLAFDAISLASNGLLEKLIAEKKGCSLEEASAFIATEVQNVFVKLERDQTIQFEGIGYFSKAVGHIRFEQEPGTNFHTGSYGLSAVDIKRAEPILESEEKIDDEKEMVMPTKKKSSFTKIAVWIVVLILLGGGGFMGYPYLEGWLMQPKKQVSVQPPKATVPVEKAVPQDVVEKDIDQITDKKKALALPEQPAEGISFYIIAGSFKTFEKAQILAKELEKSGAKPEIIQFGELFRVSLGQFAEKKQAMLELEKVRAMKGSDAVWLLSNPN